MSKSILMTGGAGFVSSFVAEELLEGGYHIRAFEVLFLERHVPWYAAHRDQPNPTYCRVELYQSLADLKDRFETQLHECDWATVGSYVPEGVPVGKWVTQTAPQTAFYDIDTPVTLAKLGRGDFEYLSPEIIPGYDLYLSISARERVLAHHTAALEAYLMEAP